MFKLGKTKLRFYLIDIKELLGGVRCDSGILITLREKESSSLKNTY